MKISNNPLAKEAMQNHVQVHPGMKVAFVIYDGEPIRCIIHEILDIPAPIDPNDIDAGMKHTYHLVLVAENPDLNIHEYNGIVIYTIIPFDNDYVFRYVDVMD